MNSKWCSSKTFASLIKPKKRAPERSSFFYFGDDLRYQSIDRRLSKRHQNIYSFKIREPGFPLLLHIRCKNQTVKFLLCKENYWLRFRSIETIEKLN